MKEGAVEPVFRKDLSHLTWDEVYARQVTRAPLVGEWMESLRLAAGDRVLEVGAGPGHVTLLLADRVGPGGHVYAVDRSSEALAHLERRQEERGIAHIERIAADAATLAPAGLRVDATLIAMVLHHADDPAGILRNMARPLAPEGLAVVAEFHPEGPCDLGPPQAHRLSPEQIQAWCEEAGFRTLGYRRQTPEHYIVIAQRHG